jgi:phage terminase large subunit
MALPLRVPDSYSVPLPAAYYDPERLEVYRTLNEARFASTVAANEDEVRPMYALNPALRDFWETEARYKVLYGGRGSSKSHDAAGHAVFLAANYTVKILCARQFQNRISESVYTLIKDKINASPYKDEFEILKTTIRHRRTGSEFLFYGIARNLEEIKSTEGVDILWLEEAHYLNQDQWEVIEPTIRKEGAQVWLIFNPDEFTDYVYQNFVVNPPAGTIKREINWQDNPFLSITMLKVIYNYYKREPEAARHVYGGEPKMGADKSIIPIKYIIAAVDAHKKLGWEPSGMHKIGYDVADDGNDLNATVRTRGNVVMMAEEWAGLEDQLLQSCARVYNQAVMHGAQIVWDSIGVGAFAGSKFADLNEERKRKIVYEPFNAGGAVDDPKGVYMRFPHVDITNGEHFSNIKAQRWDEVAVRFRKTYEAVELGVKHPFDELISLNSETLGKTMIEKIKFELAAPHKDVDRMGKFKVESKDDLRDRGIKSPNVADALIMSLIRPKRAAATFF